MSLNYETLILVGAPRSGTSMLRDLLIRLSGFGSWPCEEINAIWRHGNRDYLTDEIPARLATEAVCHDIRQQFASIARSRGLQTVVDRTGANCLRLEFVDRVFPEAKFVHMVRDGRDVAISARESWTASLDPLALLRNVRYVPPTDWSYYASRNVSERLDRLLSRKSRVIPWGPRYEGLIEDLRHGTLLEVCALQWKQCVDAATRFLQTVPSRRVFALKYEEFVNAPDEHLYELTRFLQAPIDIDRCQKLTSTVWRSRLGRSRKVLNHQELETIESLCEGTLKAHGYELFCSPGSPRLYVEGASGAVRNSQGTRRRAG